MALAEDPGGDGQVSQLNVWLDELNVISGANMITSNDLGAHKPSEIGAPRIDTYRFSLATLEGTQDADLDAILGELCALDSEYDEEISRVSNAAAAKENREHNNQRNPQRQECEAKACHMPRTDSPDNDSAFSDTVSMMSTESATSSSSSKCKTVISVIHNGPKIQDLAFQQKAEKIRLALEKMREANITKLFMKAFSVDGSSKSLLVDEKMPCGYVTRLLADKNHITMEPKWSVIEHLTDLHMERVYEDHELLVDNLMSWTRDSKNKIYFDERPYKVQLFLTPEKFLLTEDDPGWSAVHDEHSRQVILDEFFGQNSGTNSSVPSVSGYPVPTMEGQLFLKSESKKGWKKYHFVVRPSGLYYSPKEKAKTLKELVCLATFDNNEVYVGVNWKKKYKSPTDFGFAIKHPRLQQPKSVKYIKFLCADDQQTLERWVTAIRIAKNGRQLLDSYRLLVEELAQEELERLARARSCSDASIAVNTNGVATATVTTPSQTAPSSAASVVSSEISSTCGRHSRASSSSSSGCLSDGGTASESAFDCEFPMGTIKRKPSMKPNIPLTWMTRQLKEMVENDNEFCEADEYETAIGDTGTLTRKPRQQQKDDSTLKRHNKFDKPELNALNKSSGFHLSANNSPARQTTGSIYYDSLVNRDPIYGKTAENNPSLYGYAKIYEGTQKKKAENAGNIEDFPLPPPPDMSLDVTDIMFSSTLSLDSLPPPPPPEPQDELTGSQLSLPPPPPEAGPGRVYDIVTQLSQQQLEQTNRGRPPIRHSADAPRQSFPRQPSVDSMSSVSSRASSMVSEKSVCAPTAAYGACVGELQAKKQNPGPPVNKKPIIETNKGERASSIKKQVNFDDNLTICGDSPVKKNKKITFVLPGIDEPPPLSPRKPVPPKRNESTRLSTSPKKLADSTNNPPPEFLEHLQIVMNKKWQVAQKCKNDESTTPHEVLGFREYPLAEQFKETSVSNWVDVHYGDDILDPRYVNVPDYGKAGGYDNSGGYATPANAGNAKIVRRDEAPRQTRRPPPAPPRRSDSTQLSVRPA